MLETLILSVCSFGSSVFAANASRCDTVVPFVKRLVITCIECQTFKSDFSFSFFFLFFLGGGGGDMGESEGMLPSQFIPVCKLRHVKHTQLSFSDFILYMLILLILFHNKSI